MSQKRKSQGKLKKMQNIELNEALYIKFIGHSKRSDERKIYRINAYIRKGGKSQINNLSPHSRA